MGIAQRSKMTAEEYLAWEVAQPTKHEFFDGEVHAMAGGSLRHNALCANVSSALTGALRPRGCAVMSSDQRVGVWSRPRYMYPDVSVVCGKAEIGKHSVLMNPTILVEVLSKTTEQADRGRKWDSYRRIASLKDYVLVWQTEPRIEHFQRMVDGNWVHRSVGPGESVKLSSEAELIVDEIFAGTLELDGNEPSEFDD